MNSLQLQIENAAKMRCEFLLARESAVSQKETELRTRESILNIAETRISEDPQTESIVIIVTRLQMVESKRNTLAGVLDEMTPAQPSEERG